MQLRPLRRLLCAASAAALLAAALVFSWSPGQLDATGAVEYRATAHLYGALGLVLTALALIVAGVAYRSDPITVVFSALVLSAVLVLGIVLCIPLHMSMATHSQLPVLLPPLELLGVGVFVGTTALALFCGVA